MKYLPIVILLALGVPALGVADVVVPIDSVEKHVNVRFAADAKSEIVGRLLQGEHLPYVKSIPDWHEVELQGGGTGFIHADWCVVVGDEPAVAQEDAAKPVPEAESEPQVVEQTPDAEEAPAVEPVVEDSVAGANEDIDVADAEAPDTQVADESTVDEEDPADVTADTQAVVATADDSLTAVVPLVEAQGAKGDPGPPGPQGPAGAPGASTIEGSPDYLMKFTSPTIGGNSQVFDNGRNIGIGTTEPKQRLEVNGNIQIHERNSNVAALMLTQADGDTGYIMHNRANTLTIGAGSVDRITVDGDGNVGIGTSRPTHPFEMASGAYVTAGGVWTNSSSITKKENIVELTPEEAIRVLVDLEPVHYNYIDDDGEEYIGFIAEHVPGLVATSDRTGLSAMDIVAVLTKVVQEQQARIEELERKIEQRQ